MKYIILDVDNLAHRAWHALKTVYANNKPLVFGILRDLKLFSDRLGSKRFLFCFDHPKVSRRMFYAPYKMNHADTEEKRSVKKQVSLLREEILPMLGYENLYYEYGAEADDLCAFLCQHRSEKDEYALVSTDQDLYQLLEQGKVSIYNPMTKLEITERNVSTGIGVTGREKLVLLKAIKGCRSDNIGGVPGVGVVSAVSYLTDKLEETSQKYKAIKSNELLINRNKRLVQIPYSDLPDTRLAVSNDTLSGRYDVWAEVMKSLGYDSLCGSCP